MVYAARTPGAAATPSPAAHEAVDRATGSTAEPLPAAQRGAFERSLGTDLSGVRVHTDQESASAAGAISARAFAVNQDIHFGAGQYQPGSAAGDHLLAHEVAHTVQQRGGAAHAPQAKLAISSPGDTAEVEADTAADAMVAGAPARVTAAAPAIARDATGAAPAPATTPAPAPAAGGPAAGDVVGHPTPADVTAAERFAGGRPHGPRSLVPSTGMGGFDATYTPTPAGPGTLQIDIHAAVNFVDPIRAGGGGQAAATNPDYQQMADALNALKPAQRAALIPQFTWATAAAERQKWMDRLKASVESAWSHRHQFHVQRAGWDWIGSKVGVNVTVAARTTRHHGDHVSVDAVKTPPHSNLYSFGMFSFCDPGSEHNAHDQSIRISSEDVKPRPDDLLGKTSIHFAEGSATLDAAAQATLIGWVRTYQGDPKNPASHAVSVDIEGFASRSGSAKHNQELSEQRVKAVVDFMASHGFTNVATRTTQVGRGESAADQTTENANDRRVDLKIKHHGSQVLAAHEFGHAVGLGDQYATQDTAGNPTNITGTGAQTGQAAAHDGLTKQMLDKQGHHLPGAIYENNDGIMSGGDQVKAEDYSTFAEALRKVSGVDEWALGAPHPKASVVAAASASHGAAAPHTASSASPHHGAGAG